MVEWWKAGPLCKCPECGKGPLFESILRFRKQCPECGNSFADADAGDGPAVAVIGIAGALLVPVMLILMFGFHLSPWVTLAIMSPLTIVTCVWMLRPFKSTLFALQRHKKAGELVRDKSID